LFAAPSWLFRKAAVQAKRLGVGNVTPALGALGAAALMGGFIPNVGGPADAPQIAIERADDPQESEVVDLSAQTDDLDPVGEPTEASADRKRVASAAAKKERSGPQTVVLGSRIKRNQGTASPTAPPNQTTQQAQPAPTRSASTTKPTPDPQDDEHVPSDPQPDHGNDCEPKSGNGGGHDKHCG
jgi:hypothetical protein